MPSMKLFIKIFLDSLSLTIQELWSNRLRTFLSLFGVAIGIFCIITVLSVLDSFEKSIRDSFKRLGDDVVFITRESWSEDPMMNWWKYLKRPYCDYSEYKYLSEKSQQAEAVCMRSIIGGKEIKYNEIVSNDHFIVAATHAFGSIFSLECSSGRYFSQYESYHGYPGVLLGSKVVETLFPVNVDPIGKELKVMGHKVKILGVLKQEGKSVLGDGFDEVVILPFEFLRKFYDVTQKSNIPLIAAKAKPGVSLDELEDEIQGLMRATRKIRPRDPDNFSLNRMSILTNFLDKIFALINAAGWVIGIFSILVGAFGIANIMFVSVKSRTKIIGIKKSIGAKYIHILTEFLCESVILAIVGGLLGLIMCFLMLKLGNMFLESFELLLSLNNVLVAIIISSLAGVVAGLIPAIMAARMDPVEAIRK